MPPPPDSELPAFDLTASSTASVDPSTLSVPDAEIVQDQSLLQQGPQERGWFARVRSLAEGRRSSSPTAANKPKAASQDQAPPIIPSSSAQSLEGAPQLPIPLSRRYRSRSPPNSARKRAADSSGVKDDEAREDGEERDASVALQVIGIVLCVVVCPVVCRLGGLSTTQRCAALFVAVLVLNLVEAMPLFCLALLIPVLGTLCAVLGDQRGMVETSSLLVANVFNNVSFLVLGALVINGIFSKCGLEKRFMNYLLRLVPLDSPAFLLMMMIGTMLVCSVLYSGSIMLLAAVKPFLKLKGDKAVSAPAAKRLMLAVSFASNAGATLLPISSPVNLIAVGLLNGFEKKISSTVWAAVAVPVATLALCGTWLTLLACYRRPQEAKRNPLRALSMEELEEQAERQSAREKEEIVELGRQHYFFICLALAAVFAISVSSDLLEPIVGHPAIISLSVVVVTFGSGFMSRDEFLTLDWDLLAIVGGTNVMAFLVRETALGAQLTAVLVRSEAISMLPFLLMLALVVVFTMFAATLLGHTLSGVLILPLVVAIGVKLQAAQTVTLLCSVAIQLSTGLAHTSFDNLAAITASMGLRRKEVVLGKRDFQRVIFWATGWGALVVILLGATLCSVAFGSPPPLVIAETGTPDDLKPKVVKEALPHEIEEVGWKNDAANWKAFLDRPDKKAFAVGSMRGMKTRSWAASWGHATQEGANAAALQHCQKLDPKCHLVYPPPASSQIALWAEGETLWLRHRLVWPEKQALPSTPPVGRPRKPRSPQLRSPIVLERD